MSAAITDDAVLDAYPHEPIDHDTKHYYRGLLEGRLLINRCPACSRWHLPPSASCPDCWSEVVVPTAVSGRGTVYFPVLLHQGPPADGVDYSSPYPIVTVELEEQEGLRVTAPLVHGTLEDARVGLPVSLTWIERGGSPFPAFEPSEPSERSGPSEESDRG